MATEVLKIIKKYQSCYSNWTFKKAMKCKVIKPLLGLKCNIYDSVFKKKLEILMLLSLQVVSGVRPNLKTRNKNFSIRVEAFFIFLISLHHSTHIQ